MPVPDSADARSAVPAEALLVLPHTARAPVPCADPPAEEAAAARNWPPAPILAMAGFPLRTMAAVAHLARPARPGPSAEVALVTCFAPPSSACGRPVGVGSVTFPLVELRAATPLFSSLRQEVLGHLVRGVASDQQANKVAVGPGKRGRVLYLAAMRVAHRS